jgi:hypothetical protein
MRFLALALALFAARGFAQSVHVEPPTQVDGLDRATFQTLLRQAVTAAGHSLSNHIDAPVTLRASLLKLGTALVVTVEKIEAGQTTGSAKEKAGSVESVDDATHGAVRAVLGRREVAEASDSEKRYASSATAEPEAAPRRGNGPKLARSGVNLSGGISFGSLSSSGVGYYASVDRAWATGPLYIYVGAEASLIPNAGGSTAFLTGAHFGAQIYFLDQDFSPFAAFDFGPSIVRDGTGDVYAGLGLGGTVGVGLFRSYDIHARLGLRCSSVVATSAPSAPVNWAIFLGIGF